MRPWPRSNRPSRPEAADAHDEAVLDLIAFEMAAPDPADADASIYGDEEPAPAEPETSPSIDAPAVMPRSQQTDAGAVQPSPEPEPAAATFPRLDPGRERDRRADPRVAPPIRWRRSAA